MLELFNFPSEYIHYVKTVYTDLTATVMVNGFTTDIFNIEQSVKQGDALSCALFIIAIEGRSDFNLCLCVRLSCVSLWVGNYLRNLLGKITVFIQNQKITLT